MAELPPHVAASLKEARAGGGKRLDLYYCDLAELPSEVWSLPHLEEINLSGNRLRTIPARLKEFGHLRRLNVIANPLEDLVDIPGLVIDEGTYQRCRGQVSKSNIAGIQIDGNTAQDDENYWLAELRTLTNLRELTIAGRDSKPRPAILKVLDSLGEFESLEDLTTRGWQLAGVPAGIRSLRRLKTLNISGLGIEQLPEWIGELDLEGLYASVNKLTSAGIDRALRKLMRLKNLGLSGNPLGSIPESIFNLTALKRLDLYDCELRQIPAGILRLTNLKQLHLDRNPIQSPPEEIVEKGLSAIQDYWRQREDTGVDYLCEAKLIILGEAGAGKTSLARKIENPKYKLREREASTEGIDVIRCQFPTAIRTKDTADEQILQRDFQVNIWDFGGQEIYHATHQFFLTRRSLYVLVSDDRKEDTDFGYWLQAVEMLTDASPLLIVQNEKQDRTRDINVTQLRGRFANLRDTIATNLETNRGLERVIQSIRKELESLPHIGVGLPATWKRVREALEQDARDYISLEEYLAICQKHGFTRREDKLQLSGYLHDLGICLHFQNDPVLKNTIILKPKWGTDAVYRVLDDAAVIAARGRFTSEDLSRIWSEDKYAGMLNELLRLMMNFQLCYALEGERSFIAPQLLSFEEPSYPWDAHDSLFVRYEYQFLPKGMVTRFIVTTHHLIASDNLVWKTGVILERDGTRAEVIEEYSQRRIRVRVSGPDQRGLLAIVDDHLERLHRAFPRLQYDRYLPCPCSECRSKAEPYAFPLEKLKNRAIKGQLIQCYDSGEMVDAAELIRDILPGALRVDVTAEPATLKVGLSRQVFVSYAWTEESSTVVDELQKALEEHGIKLLRDREEVRYKDSIRDFMRRLGQGKAIVAVISEKYLKSENCMFEMLQIAQAGAFSDRIFPIVLPDANIYKPAARVRYMAYWEEQIRELDEALKQLRGEHQTNLREDLNLYADIRRLFDGISGTLRDMNALTWDQHKGSGFEELIRRILAQVG